MVALGGYYTCYRPKSGLEKKKYIQRAAPQYIYIINMRVEFLSGVRE